MALWALFRTFRPAWSLGDVRVHAALFFPRLGRDLEKEVTRLKADLEKMKVQQEETLSRLQDKQIETKSEFPRRNYLPPSLYMPSRFLAIVELNLVPFAFISLLFYHCYSKLLL